MSIGSNLSLKLAAILLLGFILLQALIWAAMALPAGGSDRRPFNLPRPGELRTMVDTLEATPAARRGALVELLNGSLYTVRVLGAAPRPPLGRRQGLDTLQRSYAAALPGRAVNVDGRRPLIGGFRERPRVSRFLAPIRVTVALRDGTVLVVNSRPSAVVRAYLRERSMLGAMGGIAVLGVLMLAVRQTTRPLVDLSRGVRHFASDLAAPDVPVRGSRELRELSGAFNEMKTRIGDLVAERTRMLAGIAHDMRTYLTRLRLRAEFIDDPGQRARAAADLDEMAALLDDTLLFARRDAERERTPERIALPEELAAFAALREEMGDPVTLAPVPDLAISAERIAFRRMLANLVDNAVRHGAQVRIAAHGEDEGEGVVIAVEDDGPGIPADALARLGEPFGRLDPSRDRQTGGAGLGLAIVRALADREGATVTFANRAEGGLVAALHFPARA